MSLLVFYYCICTFLCRFQNFNPFLSFVAISAALCRCFKVMLLVRILLLHAGPHLQVVYYYFISVTKSLKYIKLLFDDMSLPRSELFSQAMASAEVVALCHVVTTSCNWACVFPGSSKLLILPSLVYFQSVGFFLIMLCFRGFSKT